MTNAAQFRPATPPALTSDAWAHDFNEVKAYGGRTSVRRSAEQTEVARFWDYSAPPIYHALVRSVALQPGRDVARNARLFAAVAQAMDDALIAVFDAKYHGPGAGSERRPHLGRHSLPQRDGGRGARMGRQVGELAALWLRATPSP